MAARSQDHGRKPAQVRQKEGADPSLLAAGANVGVTDERNVIHFLDAHHARQFALVGVAPEGEAGLDFVHQFVGRHVGVVQLIGRDDSA